MAASRFVEVTDKELKRSEFKANAVSENPKDATKFPLKLLKGINFYFRYPK